MAKVDEYFQQHLSEEEVEVVARVMGKVLRGLGDDADWLPADLEAASPRSRCRLAWQRRRPHQVDGGVLLITLNRPDARDAVNAALAAGVAAALERLDATTTCRSGSSPGRPRLLRRHAT